MTVRLSHSSLTGMLRTEVAVGTASEMSMFFAVASGMPLSWAYVGSSLASVGAAGFGSRGAGLLVPFAGSTALVLSGRGLATGIGAVTGACAAGAAAGAGAAGACAAGAAGAAAGAAAAGAGVPDPLRAA